MTPIRMTPRTINRRWFAALAAFSLALNARADGPLIDIPSRVELSEGQLLLTPKLSAKLSIVSAGPWARERVRLVRGGENRVVWESPPLDFYLASKQSVRLKEKLLQIDLDGNGKPDWIYLSMSSGPFRSYGKPSDATRAWPDDAVQSKLLSEPWFPGVCSNPAGFIVLDDEKTAYAFNYTDEPDPFAHSNPRVQGKAHFRGVVQGVRAPDQLEVSDPLPPVVWQSIRKLLETHACSTPYIDNKPMDAQFLPKWDIKPVPFGAPHWRDNLAEGLAMYHRAQEVYAQRRQSMPKDELLTQNGLSVFRLDHFFETFAYDEIDPEDKFPDYTAMLNDYAFYLMAPQDAAEAVGFDQRRKPVDEGVLAMLAQVIRRDPKRVVAYLNLGDALWRSQRDAEAAWYYKQYVDLLKAANPKAKPPQRALDRAKAG